MNLGRAGHSDFSPELRDKEDWNVGILRTLELHPDVVAFAVDPVTSILAIGTLGGTIRIFGAPGVDTTLTLQGSAPVKFLQLSSNLLKLVCVDENDRFYLWDLTSFGQIKLEVSTRFDRPITCLVLSPSHTHALIGLETGTIKAYDLLCRRHSPYSIPNAWELYEQKKLTDGLTAYPDPSSNIPVDMVIHPRNLDLLFVAYGGGVVLIDLKERNTLRAYELIVPAGAPGGAGYLTPDLLTHRQPPVTSISVHPAGHFFVVGYGDGSIAFWAVEDEERPLLVRTLDDLDVNLVDGHKLEEYLPEGSKSKNTGSFSPREAIFKLSWSGYPNSMDPRGGTTSLVILGGQFNGDPSGINVLSLPAFNPPEPPVAASARNEGLHPHFRQAMRDSLELLDAYFYETPGLTQDYLLIPRDSPHFNGTWDPKAILLLYEAEEHSRAIDAYQFPPPSFQAPPEDSKAPSTQSTTEDTSTDSLSEDLAATLKSMSITNDPKPLSIPSALWSGPNAVVNAALTTVDRIAYEQLIRDVENWSEELVFVGGMAAPDENILKDIKYAKFEQNRILITHHRDLTVRFQDVSVQLLIPTSTSPLTSPFPRPLPTLRIDVLSLVGSPSVTAHVPPAFINDVRISDVVFANEGLEVAVVLSSGDTFIFKLKDGAQATIAERKLQDDRLVFLENVHVAEGLRFRPFLMIKSSGTPATAYALADVGFFAVSYADGSLLIVDMRGPNVVLHIDGDAHQKKHRLSLLHKPSSSDPVASLTWTICALSKDPIPRIRLIAVHSSGATNIYTLHRSPSGAWFIPSSASSSHASLTPDMPISHEVDETDTLAAPLRRGVFVLDAQSGATCKADRSRLADSLNQISQPDSIISAERSGSRSPTRRDRTSRGSRSSFESLEVGPKCFLVVAGVKGVRCFEDLGEGKTAKAEWGKTVVNAVQIVEKNGSYAFVAFTDKHEALVYSLPNLEQLHTLEFAAVSPLAPSPDITGDFITSTPLITRAPSSPTSSSQQPPAQPSPIRRLHLHTLFNQRRGYHTPLVSLVERQDGSGVHSVPAQPQPVSVGPAGLLAWLGGLVGQGAVNGAQIDALLAGPDRPVPEANAARDAAQRGSTYVEWKEDDKAKSAATSAAQAQSSLYNRLHSALAERGDMLGDLEDRFNSLEEGSKSMVTQAKRLAAKQTAKSWLPF
ncbi:hypothetical protein DENSPDRAFT_833291 [Dentipellis sp. KUC8613]|nr:hypothetical protein DENSPDRAFT_833291 [Dentipellis sp. KUC8613]